MLFLYRKEKLYNSSPQPLRLGGPAQGGGEGMGPCEWQARARAPLHLCEWQVLIEVHDRAQAPTACMSPLVCQRKHLPIMQMKLHAPVQGPTACATGTMCASMSAHRSHEWSYALQCKHPLL